MKHIGNKIAMKLAREKFGDSTGVLRLGRFFMIVKVWQHRGFCKSKHLSVTSLKGIGKSWEKALEDADIKIFDAEVRIGTGFEIPRIATPEETDKLIEESQE